MSISSTIMAEIAQVSVVHDTGYSAVPSMQEIYCTQHCTNNSTSSNQQTHRRTTSISNLLRKIGKWKVTVPPPPPPPLTRQGCVLRVTMLL